MPYRIIANLTYSNQTNRNTALAAVNAVLASYPSVEGSATNIAAGVGTSGNTGLLISLLVPDDVNIDELRIALLSAWTAGTRSSGFFSVVRA